MFPWAYKLQVLAMVYLFTILLPTLMIHLYRRYQGWNLIELGHRERRMVPYAISIICYFTCVYVMQHLHMPHFMSNIVVAGLLVQIICAIINVAWKVSTHTAAIGGVGGALFALFVMSGVAQAQVKIAHVNTAEVLDAMPDKAKAEKDLEKYYNELQNQLQAMAKEYQTKMQDYEANQATIDRDRKSVV